MAEYIADAIPELRRLAQACIADIHSSGVMRNEAFKLMGEIDRQERKTAKRLTRRIKSVENWQL